MESEIEKCLPTYMSLVHKLKVTFNNKIYTERINAHKCSLTLLMKEFDDSQVLEYLLDQENIDNVQVFLSDFVEMLVDLSVDESNVLLCGSSKQQLTNKLFEKWEQIFIQH